MGVTATHLGVHSVSGAALKAAIELASTGNSPNNTVSGLYLVPVANGQQIAVIRVT